jgi:hypothetical protein
MLAIEQGWYAQTPMNPLRIVVSSFLFAAVCAANSQSPSADLSGATLVLQARGEGVQIYTCQHDADWAWKLKGPDATLFDDKHLAIGKHFAGPKWRLDDGSEVQGKLLTSTPHAGTVPWLLLSATSTGSEGRLSHVERVARTETQGGVAPTTGCDAQHPDAEVRVPYSATYSFYTMKHEPK